MLDFSWNNDSLFEALQHWGKDLRAGPKLINFAGPLRLDSLLVQLEQEAGVKRKARRALRQLWREESELGSSGRNWGGRYGSKRSNCLEIYTETERSSETMPVKKKKMSWKSSCIREEADQSVVCCIVMKKKATVCKLWSLRNQVRFMALQATALYVSAILFKVI